MQNESEIPSADNAETTDRRTLFTRLWQLLAAAACLEFFWVGGSLLKSRWKNRSQAESSSQYIEAGTVDQFKPGDVKANPQGKFYLVCLEDGGFMAISRTCTHLGCSVPWNSEQQKFVCPCHGSTFDLKGVVTTPPAIRPLDYYPVRIEDGRIRVDISSPKKRESFETSQAMYS